MALRKRAIYVCESDTMEQLFLNNIRERSVEAWIQNWIYERDFLPLHPQLHLSTIKKEKLLDS